MYTSKIPEAIKFLINMQTCDHNPCSHFEFKILECYDMKSLAKVKPYPTLTLHFP